MNNSQLEAAIVRKIATLEMKITILQSLVAENNFDEVDSAEDREIFNLLLTNPLGEK
jgi:hypothetical protein